MTRTRIGAGLCFLGIVGMAYTQGVVPNVVSLGALVVGVACLLAWLAQLGEG